jgi:hypothetical protein
LPQFVYGPCPTGYLLFPPLVLGALGWGTLAVDVEVGVAPLLGLGPKAVTAAALVVGSTPTLASVVVDSGGDGRSLSLDSWLCCWVKSATSPNGYLGVICGTHLLFGQRALSNLATAIEGVSGTS